jgi:hypothetical protein
MTSFASKAWRYSLIALALLAAFAYFASPYLAARELQAAARDLDSERLAKLVDFPAVRAGLKTDVNAKLTEGIKSRNDPFAALALEGAQKVAGGLIEVLVQPKTLMLALRGDPVMMPRKPSSAPRTPLPPPAPPPTKPAEPSSAPREKIQATSSYESLNRFAITVPRHEPDTSGPQKAIKLELCREWLVSWKLCRVGLPF